MDPESSLPDSQLPAICPYPELLCEKLESWNIFMIRSC